MRAFDVFVNGKKICRAGIAGYSVLTTIVSSLIVDPESPTGKAMGDEYPEPFLDLQIGGLDVRTNQHLHWPRLDLKVGDEVTVKIVEADDGIDEPTEYVMPKEISQQTED